MKTVLITGAYGGMGYATSKHLSQMGYTVYALDMKCGKPEENIIPIEADLTNEKSVSSAFQKIKKKTDTLDAIIHIAGIYMLDSLVEM